MSTFYDEWLEHWDRTDAERRDARKVIDEEELEWVETPHDWRVALLIAPGSGFRTWGCESLIAELPAGRCTGQRRHGEHVMYILQGRGFSVVEGVRYDWEEGSVLAIPYGAAHQHHNPGRETVRSVSFSAVGLEAFVGLHRTEQISEKGTAGAPETFAPSADGRTPEGRRIVLSKEQAPVVTGSEGGGGQTAFSDLSADGQPLVLDGTDGMEQMLHFHHAERRRYMSILKPVNDFDVSVVEMSSVLTDPPRSAGGDHAHMEAHLYVLAGEGYSIIDGERIPWKAGSALHIQGPQTQHQHVNTSAEPSQMIRMAPGIRYFFEPSAGRVHQYLYLSPREPDEIPGA